MASPRDHDQCLRAPLAGATAPPLARSAPGRPARRGGGRHDLRAGEADLAVRYVRSAPSDEPSFEIQRDTFYPACTPQLLAEKPVGHPRDLVDHTLVHLGWPSDPYSPTWKRWLSFARSSFGEVPEIDLSRGITFKEELHGIEAVIGGQGVAICSDVLVGDELASSALVRVFDLPLPGFGFFLVHREGSPREPIIMAFRDWLLEDELGRTKSTR